MSASTVLFVSKRLQRPAAALILLSAVQLTGAVLSSCTPEFSPMAPRVAVRVPIAR